MNADKRKRIRKGRECKRNSRERDNQINEEREKREEMGGRERNTWLGQDWGQP